jgi:hypothetical protein
MEHEVKRLECHLPDSLYEVLLERMPTDKTSCDHAVSTALSECLGKSLHTLFQVSTSAALVEGHYQGAVKVERLLSHGDFGLCTFIDLDREIKAESRSYGVDRRQLRHGGGREEAEIRTHVRSGFWARQCCDVCRGLWGSRIYGCAPDQIGPPLQRAFEIYGPVLIGIRVDYHDNYKLFEKMHEHLLN